MDPPPAAEPEPTPAPAPQVTRKPETVAQPAKARPAKDSKDKRANAK
jgi:hypothetical protein